MPKLINNLRERLLAEARRSLLEGGYASTSIRAVAQACGVATGTVYNYFPSKEELVANAILEDWLAHVTAMGDKLANQQGVLAGLAVIHEGIADFYRRYAGVFAQSGTQLAGEAYASRHALLRAQIEELLSSLAQGSGHTPTPIALHIAAETMLASVTGGWPTADTFDVIQRLIT